MAKPVEHPVTVPMNATRMRLLETGLGMLLEHGYNDLGIQALLEATGVPKGSFYHHFASKEDFALAVVDLYMANVHAQLDEALLQTDVPPLDRIRNFLTETRRAYAQQGYLGCLLGGLGQELSGVNARFREKIEGCFATMAARFSETLEVARASGDLPPSADPAGLANLLIDCWEGAALRSRLKRDRTPLDAVLAFYFAAARADG